LIHDLLATAATTKNLPIAAKAVEVASQLTTQLREDKQPAPPEFFQSVVESLSHTKQPELKDAAFKAQLQLAEYRSSLLTMHFNSSTLRCGDEAGRKESFPGASFSDITLDGCVVVLDGRRFDHVALANSHIIYKGGPLHLYEVIFVNCTFDVTPTPYGSQLLDYAALNQQQLSVGM